MREGKNYSRWQVFWSITFLVLYAAGALLMKTPDLGRLKEAGLVQQEEHVIVYPDGDEYYATDSMIDIAGIGSILTYRDLYYFAVPLFFASLFLGCIIFKGTISTSEMDIKHVIFAHCILGLLLIWVTSKENIPSTVLYWLSLFAAGVCAMIEPKEEQKSE